MRDFGAFYCRPGDSLVKQMVWFASSYGPATVSCDLVFQGASERVKAGTEAGCTLHSDDLSSGVGRRVLHLRASEVLQPTDLLTLAAQNCPRAKWKAGNDESKLCVLNDVGKTDAFVPPAMGNL